MQGELRGALTVVEEAAVEHEPSGRRDAAAGDGHDGIKEIVASGSRQRASRRAGEGCSNHVPTGRRRHDERSRGDVRERRPAHRARLTRECARVSADGRVDVRIAATPDKKQGGQNTPSLHAYPVRKAYAAPRPEPNPLNLPVAPSQSLTSLSDRIARRWTAPHIDPPLKSVRIRRWSQATPLRIAGSKRGSPVPPQAG